MSPPRIGVYPGTFDPVTNGHLDIIGRATDIVDKLIVAVSINADKNPMFSATISDYDFILANNIKLIAIPSHDLIKNKNKYKKLLKKNVFIFVYTSNNKKFIQEHIDVNVSGFYTDFWDLKKNVCTSKTCITY